MNLKDWFPHESLWLPTPKFCAKCKTIKRDFRRSVCEECFRKAIQETRFMREKN